MANTLKTPLQKAAWLAIVLVCLTLPVAAVAHDHPDGEHGDAAKVLDSCLLCQVTAQKLGPLPVSRIAPPLPPLALVGTFYATDSDVSLGPLVSLPRVRGPPPA